MSWEHLLTREPPDHTRLRRLVSGRFTAKQMERVRGRVQQVADSLIDGIQSRGHAELITDFAYPLAITVICELLGIPPGDRIHFRQWTSNAVTSAGGRTSGCPAAPVPSPGSYLRALVAERRDRSGDDLISLLISGAGEGKVSETELLSMIFLLLLMLLLLLRGSRGHHRADRQRHCVSSRPPRPARGAAPPPRAVGRGCRGDHPL